MSFNDFSKHWSSSTINLHDSIHEKIMILKKTYFFRSTVHIANKLNYRKRRKKFYGNGFLWRKHKNIANKIYITFAFSYITSPCGKFYLTTRIHSSHGPLQVTAGAYKLSEDFEKPYFHKY